ncbi:hypothetical protein QBC37DRAFT_404385 [Rhypophila decipiens]|uniref:C2H2-type domain-containing protein n=1 Tax=Rhypophila decipiens TaxID=261697 RepID=A0AAN7B3X1_9PEZI|nr:hypothetical protein QBC37DRAFT_404385 [Rhypophila decipiens]
MSDKDSQVRGQDIYSRARDCQTLFTTYLKVKRKYGQQISEYDSRFLAWTSFLGVFARQSASLDRRLEYHVDIKDLVIGMLRVLEKNLRYGGYSISLHGNLAFLGRSTGLSDLVWLFARRRETTIRQAFKDTRKNESPMASIKWSWRLFIICSQRQRSRSKFSLPKAFRTEGTGFCGAWGIPGSWPMIGVIRPPVQGWLAAHEMGVERIDHLDADLKPFVCCSEECGYISPAFSRTAEWKAHMHNNHREKWALYINRAQWICPYCSLEDPAEPPANFMSEESLISHLTATDGSRTAKTSRSHPALTKGVELDQIVARSKSYNARVPGQCPLCGPLPKSGDDLDSKTRNVGQQPPDAQTQTLDWPKRTQVVRTLGMEKHMTDHLLHLALLSLRWWEDDTSTNKSLGESGDLDSSGKVMAAGYNSQRSMCHPTGAWDISQADPSPQSMEEAHPEAPIKHSSQLWSEEKEKHKQPEPGQTTDAWKAGELLMEPPELQTPLDWDRELSATPGPQLSQEEIAHAL